MNNDKKIEIIHDLLMIDPVINEDLLMRYDNTLWYDGLSPSSSISENTCVGTNFISENIDINKRKDCIMEFNFGDSESRSLNDSSGKQHKGLIIGDFSVKKLSKEIDVSKETDINIPEKSDEDKAF